MLPLFHYFFIKTSQALSSNLRYSALLIPITRNREVGNFVNLLSQRHLKPHFQIIRIQQAKFQITALRPTKASSGVYCQPNLGSQYLPWASQSRRLRIPLNWPIAILQEGYSLAKAPNMSSFKRRVRTGGRC